MVLRILGLQLLLVIQEHTEDFDVNLVKTVQSVQGVIVVRFKLMGNELVVVLINKINDCIVGHVENLDQQVLYLGE